MNHTRRKQQMTHNILCKPIGPLCKFNMERQFNTFLHNIKTKTDRKEGKTISFYSIPYILHFNTYDGFLWTRKQM